MKPFMTKEGAEIFRRLTLEGRAEKGLETDMEKIVEFYEERIPIYGAALRTILFGPWIDEDGEDEEESGSDSSKNNP